MRNLADALYNGLILLGYEPFTSNTDRVKSYYRLIHLDSSHLLVINIKQSTYSTSIPNNLTEKPIEKNSLAYIHTLASNLI